MRISDWSSTCALPISFAVVHADEDRPGWSVRRRTGAGPCDPRRAVEPLWAGQAAGRAVPLLYWRAAPGRFRAVHGLSRLLRHLAGGAWASRQPHIGRAGAGAGLVHRDSARVLAGLAADRRRGSQIGRAHV